MKRLYLLFLIFLCLGMGVAKAQYTILHNFNNADSASSCPSGAVVISGKKLYGMTASLSRARGTIYSMDTSGLNYKDIFVLNGSNGSAPYGSLTLIGKNLYGMTNTGGLHDSGVLFRVDTNGGGYKVLYNFNLPKGGLPFGSLLLVRNKFYGTTSAGGKDSNGCIFSIDTNGTGYQDLLDFNVINGSQPMGTPILVRNKLYCTAKEGGVLGGHGSILSIDTNGTGYKKIFDFNNFDGYSCKTDLLLIGKTLFGMTRYGGSKAAGNIFSIDTNGSSFTDIKDFAPADGEDPEGNLLVVGNQLYGLTSEGGSLLWGNAFSINTNGTGFNDFFDFNYTDGYYPYGSFTLSGNALYGVADQGGTGVYFGVIFKFNGMVCALSDTGSSKTNLLCSGDNSGKAELNISNGAYPYIYSWSNGGTTSAISGLSAGVYTCKITDYYGCVVADTFNITEPNAINTSVLTTPVRCGIAGSAVVSANGGTGSLTYSWSSGGGTQATASALNAGTYTCGVTDSNGCIKDVIIVIDSTGPMTTISPDKTISPGDSASIRATGGITYSWSPSDGLSCNNCPDPNASPSQTTEYCVSITDSNGCTGSLCTVIHVDIPCDEVFIPNAFSPNNDGQNDVLYVRDNCIKTMDFLIFDRWGNKVFESENVSAGWDGTYHGQPMNTGTYTYSLKALMLDGTTISRKGNITLVR